MVRQITLSATLKAITKFNFVSEAFSCLSSFYSPLTLLYLGGFEIDSVQGMANWESLPAVMLC